MLPGFPFFKTTPETKILRKPTFRLALLSMANIGWASLIPRNFERPRDNGYELFGELNIGSEALVRAVEAITGATISYGNRVEVLTNGDQIFPSMLEAIYSAQKTLNLVTFVYWKGPIAPQIAAAIGEKAREGVCCN